MRRIAAEVGVQVGALYLYTPDKQALLFDLLRDHMEGLLAAWSDLHDPAAPPDAQLDAFVRFHVSYHFDRPDEVFLSYMELRNLTAENFAQVETLRRAYEDELAGIVSRGAAAGVFDIGDARLTTFALIAMLTGITSWFRDTGRLSRAEVTEAYVAMARRLVGL